MRLSELFGVSPARLGKLGVFDRFVDIDSALHVDPHLVRRSRVPEMGAAKQALNRHFESVVKLLRSMKQEGDVFWRRSVRLLTFREVPAAGLGYAVGHSSGSGIGAELAESIARTGKQIVDAGITDPEVFELVGLLEEGIGPDRISDMVVAIAIKSFAAYTQRVCKKCGIPTLPVTLLDQRLMLPQVPNTKRPVIFFPRAVLRDLPVAFDWDGVHAVCSYNEQLRRRVNAQIGRTWKRAAERLRKRDLRDALLDTPGALEQLLAEYQATQSRSYDFSTDPKAEFLWHEQGRLFAKRFPLNLSAFQGRKNVDVVAAVREIITQFRRLVEQNGLDAVLRGRNEKMSQLTFFAVASSYCDANNLDLSAEPNAGRGPVDFKFSQGAIQKILVEIKLSSNTKLWHGFETQLPVYAKAEDSRFDFLLIVRNTQSDATIRRIVRTANAHARQRRRVPEVVVVDARRKRSASKA